MQEYKKRVDKLLKNFNQVTKALGLEDKSTELLKLEAKATDPDFWDDQENARMVMKKIGDLKKELKVIKDINKDLIKLGKLIDTKGEDQKLEQEIKRLGKEIGKFKLTTYLSGIYTRWARRCGSNGLDKYVI
jgi:peptide chain release factor 2